VNKDRKHVKTSKTHQLERNGELADGQMLTTNQGLLVNDDQNSLKAGDRGPSILEDFHLREKITHFYPERIPERVVHARGSAAHGFFQVYESMAQYYESQIPPKPLGEDACLCTILHRGWITWVSGPRPRRARVCREVLHRRGQFRPGRQ